MSNALAEEHRDAQRRMALLTRYYQWTFSLIEPHLGQRVLDAGCGIGNLTGLLAARCREVVAVDDDERSIQILRSRFHECQNVRALTADLPTADLVQLTGGGFDSIVSLDFLEHVEDDAALLCSFRRAAAPDGRLLLKVPARPGLFGRIDVRSLPTIFDGLPSRCAFPRGLESDACEIHELLWCLRVLVAVRPSEEEDKLLADVQSINLTTHQCGDSGAEVDRPAAGTSHRTVHRGGGAA